MSDQSLSLSTAASSRSRLVRTIVMPHGVIGERRLYVTEIVPEGRAPWLLLVACSRDAEVLERRRLAPYPSEWRDLPDATLAAHWELASPTRETAPIPASVEGLAEELRVARAMLAAARARERELLALLAEREGDLAIADEQLRAFDRELQALEVRMTEQARAEAPPHPAA